MKFKPSIRQAVSQVFDILIPQNKWNDYMTMLDRDGHPNRRELVALVLVFGKHIEQLEQAVEDLYFRLELSEGKTPSRIPQEAEMKEMQLRTPADVATDLVNLCTPDTRVFYLSDADWIILEKTVNAELSKTNPDYGYGKETDPRDFTEKVCLYFNGLPVFKK